MGARFWIYGWQGSRPWGAPTEDRNSAHGIARRQRLHQAVEDVVE